MTTSIRRSTKQTRRGWFWRSADYGRDSSGTLLYMSPEQQRGDDPTPAQWRAVMGNNPSYFLGDDNRPVEQVSWEDCQKFVEKCNAAAKGVRFALPTEAEWEYACRAGSTGSYAGTGALHEMGWYDDNSGGGTHPVGWKRPNAWDLYDMHGNVWEWCADWRDAYEGCCTDPTGPVSGKNRVLRGGS